MYKPEDVDYGRSREPECNMTNGVPYSAVPKESSRVEDFAESLNC